jgi:hypothetical protein
LEPLTGFEARGIGAAGHWALFDEGSRATDAGKGVAVLLVPGAVIAVKVLPVAVPPLLWETRFCFCKNN